MLNVKILLPQGNVNLKRIKFMLKCKWIFVFIISFNSIFADESKSLLLFSTRKEQIIKPLCELYEKNKGVKVFLFVSDDESLIDMIDREKQNSKADLLMTIDVSNLCFATSKNIFEEVNSEKLKANIPEHLKDPKNRWFGLSIRARTIVYNSKIVKPDNLSSYADLADKRWKGKLALRSSSSVFTQSLVAGLLSINGEQKTLSIVKGWVNNLAVEVFDNDLKILDSIVAGNADVGIVNTYYFGRFMKDKPTAPLKLFWSDQKDNGVHVNITGAGLIKYSKNKEEAIKFLEWLTEEEAQSYISESNMEFPVNPAIKANESVLGWGEFKQCQTPLSKVGDLRSEAIRLMKIAKYK